MLRDAPKPPEGLGTKQPSRSDVKTEVVWFPAVLLLFAFQTVVVMHGFSTPLPPDVRLAFFASLSLAGLCLALLFLAILRTATLWRTLALCSLVVAVAADIFVAASTATGAMGDGLWIALLVVAAWAAIWSITDSQSAL